MAASPLDEKLIATLRDARARFGDGILEDRRRLTSLLGDLVPEARREIRLVGLAMDEGVPGDLRRAPLPEMRLHAQRLAARLENADGIRPEVAHWAVTIWLRALDIPVPEGFEAMEAPARPVAAEPPPQPPLAPVPPSGSPFAWATARPGLIGGAAAAVLLVAGLGLWTGREAGPPETGAEARPAAQPQPQLSAAPSPATRADPGPPAASTMLAPAASAAEAPVTWVPGRSLAARFQVPGSPIRYTVTLRQDGAAAAWSALDPAGRRSAGRGTLARVADANGHAWDWSRVAWSEENALGLKPLCLAAYAGRVGGEPDVEGGLVCLYDETCAAAYGCLRMRTRETRP